MRVGDSAPAPAFAPASAPCLDEHMAGVYQGSESELDHLWKAILAMHRPTLALRASYLGALPGCEQSLPPLPGHDLHPGLVVCRCVLAACGPGSLDSVGLTRPGRGAELRWLITLPIKGLEVRMSR